jgi:hypothetical protein
MSESHPAPHEEHVTEHVTGHAIAGVPTLFPTEEWLQFQRSDMGAGRVVVTLMAAIFSVGLVLYLTIALICMS